MLAQPGASEVKIDGIIQYHSRGTATNDHNMLLPFQQTF
jgi:hypothetical protein